MESLKKIKINHPLLKEIRQADNYAKHMKDLVENKPSTEEDEEIRMNPRCSALLQNHLPPKEQDPRSFIVPCSIGKLDFNNALADLGASINVINLSMYKDLGIRKLKAINMVIEIADSTKCTPKGIVENLLIKIDKFIFSVPVILAGTPSSTIIDQDAPSPSHSPSSSKLQPPILHQGVAFGSTIIKDNLFAHADNDPFVNVFTPKPSSKASSSGDTSSAESTHVTQPHNHLRK
uniref:Reverse transcriptase domain-containing protein n=1 Tax=Tanacetum cinerariifolium TaxID=118510 RepID=A0A699HIF4_TANCI|nr:hypothetical protein [Tanacetum cinerariifolium]